MTETELSYCMAGNVEEFNHANENNLNPYNKTFIDDVYTVEHVSVLPRVLTRLTQV